MHWAPPAGFTLFRMWKEGGGMGEEGRTTLEGRHSTARGGLVSTSITLCISCKLIVQTKLKRSPVTACLVLAVGDDSAFCSLDFPSHCASWPADEKRRGTNRLVCLVRVCQSVSSGLSRHHAGMLHDGSALITCLQL